MDYFFNIFGLLLLCGIVAIIIVVVLYRRQNQKQSNVANGSIIDTNTEVIEKAGDLVALNAESLKAYLSPLRNDHPVFIHNIANLLERAKKKSDIKVIRAVTAQLEVQNELLEKIDEYEEKFHTLSRKADDFKRRDEIQELTHTRDRQRILNEIEQLVNAKDKKEDKYKKELENLELKETHKHRVLEVKDRISSAYESNKRLRKLQEVDAMVASYERQKQAYEKNNSLSVSVRKEALRTLEETFMSQLDDFKQSL